MEPCSPCLSGASHAKEDGTFPPYLPLSHARSWADPCKPVCQPVSTRQNLCFSTLHQDVRNGQPLTTAATEGRFTTSQEIQVVVTAYKLPSQDDLGEKFLPRKVSALQTKISSSLVGVEYVCIALDMWTPRSMKGFLAVGVTFIDSDFTAHTYLLSFTCLTGSHTAALICSEYDAALLQWNIADKVLLVVTDNTSSIIKGFAFIGRETEEDDDDDNCDDCPERLTTELPRRSNFDLAALPTACSLP
ncbi:uncharacterized protein LOC142586041 isoform X2 [Dermacentor variabilis]|uniref:uncharacterized protein LOC142586041 isoform X2 n=1 Tax=Dermacentor variabilis TaxID=34621 RepID=UPI003F5C8C5F